MLISDYIPISSTEKLYFALAESRNDPDTDPLVVWLQGGPGCSSMLGFFGENGPYNYVYNTSSMSDRFDFERNDFSWNNNANVMYVDQPVGTGYSFAKFFSHRVFMFQV